jgi:thiol:disulfide interchange protein
MNRTEFMTRLASLLQDIQEEERAEALQYYNDFFDDAGKENEQAVIRELGSPEKVASVIKSDLGAYGDSSEKQDTAGLCERQSANGAGASEPGERKPPRTSKTLKIILIVLILLAASPILIPLALMIICIVAAIIITVAAVAIGLLAAAVAVAIAGVSIFVAGIVAIIPQLAVGLALMGSGMVITVIGVIATVAIVKLGMVAIPGMIHGITWLCGRLFHRRAVA